MSPEDTHNNAQQDQGDKTPKYPSPRLMTAAVDGRFFGFLTHEATANLIFSIRFGALSSVTSAGSVLPCPDGRTAVSSSGSLSGNFNEPE
jgi:hypothetical protein